MRDVLSRAARAAGLLVLPLIVLLMLHVPVAYGQYQLQSVTDTPYGLQGYATFVGTAASSSTVLNISFEVYMETDSRVRVKIMDAANANRWQVPQSLLAIPTATTKAPPAMSLYSFSYTSMPFGFAVTRRGDGYVLFNSTLPAELSGNEAYVMRFEDQYLQLTTQLQPNPYVYGLGERIDHFRLPLNEVYTIWNIDQGNPDHLNLYGGCSACSIGSVCRHCVHAAIPR